MSIYIAGLDIPKNEPVALYIYPDGRSKLWLPHAAVGCEYRAITVPDHGRLGDLDYLHETFMNTVMGDGADSFGKLMVFLAAECIKAAPTIIPADKEFSVQKDFLQNWHEEDQT